MRNTLLGILLSAFVLCSFPTPAFSDSLVNVDFVYITVNENNGAVFETVSAVDEGVVLPYATMKLTFDHPLGETERLDFQNQLRIRNETDGVVLRHLHEITPDIPAADVHASFHWRNNNSELVYTPEGLEQNKLFTIILPEGWSSGNGWEEFQTQTLTGTAQRFYNIIVSEKESWELLTSIHALEQSMSFTDCVFQDVMENKIYPDAKCRARGQAGSMWRKKNFTIDFNKDNPFTKFQDSLEEYQGPRRSIVLNGNWDDLEFLSSRISLAAIRKIEQRVSGIQLTPDGYSSFIAVNGQFWGPYDVLEHIEAGKYGWTQTLARKNFGFKRNSFLYKKHRTGRVFAPLGLSMRPEYEYDYPIGIGDGVNRHFAGNIPYEIFVQRPSDDGYYPFDINFEVEADSAIDGEQMELKAIFEEDIEPPYEYFDIIDKKTEQLAGSLSRTQVDGFVDVTFLEPVKNGEKVTVEFQSTTDYKTFEDAIYFHPEKMFDWMDLDNVLKQIFYCRLSQANDNINANLHHAMFDQDNYETFLDENGDPLSKYFVVMWDLNHTFDPYPLTRLKPTRDDFPLYWKLAENSPEARQRYIDLFWGELQEGGLLTEGYYNNMVDQLLAEWGNGLELEKWRWQKPLFVNYIRNFVSIQFNDHDFLYNYLLSLNPDNYIPPSIDGQLNLLTPVVPSGGELVYEVTFTNRTDQPKNFRYASLLQRPNGKLHEKFIVPPNVLDLLPRETKTFTKKHVLPADMPPGDYTYIGKLGDAKINSLWDTERFTFTVTAP